MMHVMRRSLLCAAALTVAATTAMAAERQTNLLKNGGFEDPQNWLNHWSVENTRKNGAPYYYALDEKGGGHGEARPHCGKRAIEIYSSDRVTRLAQKVSLEPNKYRVVAFAWDQGGGNDAPQLHISLGKQEQSVAVVARDYRRYYADFEVKTRGEYEAAFVSSSGGIALDDLALTAIPDNGAEPTPYLFFDLHPTSRQRSLGFQPYLAGQLQWVNFTVSCIDPERLRAPSLRLYCPEDVRISGFNEGFLKQYATAKSGAAAVRVEKAIVDGASCRRYSLPLPQFVNGPRAPLDFGGFWVEVPSGKEARLRVEFEDGGKVFPPQEIILQPVQPPSRQVTPRKILTVAYCVQSWTQDLACRLAALPRQFAMMGLNVWSDYSLCAWNASPDKLSPEDNVRVKAFHEQGVREFWPNFSCLFETSGGGCYPNLAAKSSDPDMLAVNADGTTNAACYNMRYVAQGGAAWRDSALAAYRAMLAWPAQAKLPFRYGGIINDSFESLLISYDKTTLADFAHKAKIDPQEATVANLKGRLKPRWLSYNMGLYRRATRLWADAMRQVDPNVKTVNTLDAFGPGGGESLPLGERMEWAKSFSYTMPQWYAQRYYGDGYHGEITKGVAGKVYGRANGHADVIPLLNLSMGSGLDDPVNLRFMMFDLLSTSPAVKGIGYYIASLGFADGQFMADLSQNHTLLADVEDYYVDGARGDQFVHFAADPKPIPATRGMDENGQSALMLPKIATTVRVHTLGRQGRIALLTVISHCDQGLGERGVVTCDRSFLEKFAVRPADVAIIDRLNRAVRPFSEQIRVDTTSTGCMALLEIAEKSFAAHDASLIVPVAPMRAPAEKADSHEPQQTLAGSGVRAGVRIPDAADVRLTWAKERLEAALAKAGCEATAGGKPAVDVSVEMPQAQEGVKSGSSEGFRLVASKGRVSVIGSDAAGAMYGCLELAQRVRRTGRLPENLDLCDRPKMSLRGTCILLMKLGSYDYPVAPKEFPFFYDRKLWSEYLDFLADNRFNYIAFWNGHPFDYFVKLDRYPEAQSGMAPGLLEKNHEMLMWLGKEAEKRNIWLMFQFYNIHTSVYYRRAHGFSSCLHAKPTPELADYTGCCIERFVREFPSIGLYICPGEALQLQYTDAWIKDVILAAVKRTGKTPPVMIRAWGIDLPHMKKLAGSYPRLYTERKYNVEMIVGTDVDPENREWSKVTGNHVVNIHCMGNLEPFRWSPPAYVQRCVHSAIGDGGGTGLHLYPRKAWRWPYGCDRVDPPELQWHRDWMWFEVWARYAWDPDRDPAAERAYWIARLAEHYGPAAAPHVLNAFEDSADALPALQRLIWLHYDNHFVISSGVTLDQLQTGGGVPFLPVPGMIRIPQWLAALKDGKTLPGQTPVELLSAVVKAAELAWREARLGAEVAACNQADAGRLAADMQAITYVAEFYRDKLAALAAKTRADAGIDAAENRKAFLRELRASVDDFRKLTELTKRAYDSTSDVPAWFPTQELPCPYHWSNLLPLYEEELAKHERTGS